MIEVDKFFFVIPLGRVSGDDPALWQLPGVAGRPHPGSGANDDDHETRDDPQGGGRSPEVAGSLPQVAAGLARLPRLLSLLCAFLFGVARTSSATSRFVIQGNRNSLSGARFDRARSTNAAHRTLTRTTTVAQAASLSAA